MGNFLKRAKPAGLPLKQLTKFELTINLKAAKQIGLTITAGVLASADKVIHSRRTPLCVPDEPIQNNNHEGAGEEAYDCEQYYRPHGKCACVRVAACWRK